jgi:hypothetical protein
MPYYINLLHLVNTFGKCTRLGRVPAAFLRCLGRQPPLSARAAADVGAALVHKFSDRVLPVRGHEHPRQADASVLVSGVFQRLQERFCI